LRHSAGAVVYSRKIMNAYARPQFEYLDHEDPIAFAHQGGDQAGWERRNTMPAFEAAYVLGYRYFETDAICSADDQVIAFHGSGSRREEERSGLPLRSLLQTLPYDEIRDKYEIGGEEMPLMADVLTTWPDVRVNIDPKTKEAVLPLARLIRKLGVVNRVCVTSFSNDRIKGVAEELGGREKVCTGLGPLGAIALKSQGLLVPGYLARTKAACLQLPYQHVSKRMVEYARHYGLDTHVWTPNDASHMREALEKEVDGVMTDNIVALKQVLIDREEWAEAA